MDRGQSIYSVEILRDDGSYWCSLPDLPDQRSWHSQSGLITCGGGSFYGNVRRSCLTFSAGQWNMSHRLAYQRYYHVSWISQQGVVLIGGEISDGETETLTDDGESTEGFKLKYDLT